MFFLGHPLKDRAQLLMRLVTASTWSGLVWPSFTLCLKSRLWGYLQAGLFTNEAIQNNTVIMETEVCYLFSGEGQCRQVQHERPHKTMPITLTLTSGCRCISVSVPISLLGINKHSCVDFVLRPNDEPAPPL